MLLSVILLFFHLWGNVEVSSSQIECFTLPDVPHANISEETKRIDYQGGHVIHFTCDLGYTTSGSTIRYVCTSEGWLAVQQESCSPRSCGRPGEAQFADFHLEIGDDFVFGSQVVYTCNKGYQMVSRKNYRYCLVEGWDGVVPVCEAQQCPVIHVDDNVQVIGNPEEATYGNVVQFSCKTRSEILSGSQEMYCDENGEWLGKIPECKAITCPVPTIENGFVPGNKPEYKEEDILEFSCNDAYKRTVERPSKCLKHGIRAEWSPTPACEPIRCRLPLPLLEGTTYEPPSRNVFSPGERVRVNCGDKNWISNARDTSAVTTCKENGEWTFRPLCQEVICSYRKPQHVNRWSVGQWQRITLGETATYSCRTGYKMTDGATLAKCTRDGWNPNPLCEEITCNSQHYEDSDIDGEEKHMYRFNEKVNYVCKAGYEGRFTLTCKERGWFGNPQCRTPLDCGTSPSLTDGDTIETLRFQHRHNERVEYRCQNYYTMEGEPYKTCINGEWIGQMRCLKPCTVDEEAMRSHNIKFAYHSDLKLYLTHNEYLTFNCIDRRMSVDTSGMRYQCVDGEMHLPTCQ